MHDCRERRALIHQRLCCPGSDAVVPRSGGSPGFSSVFHPHWLVERRDHLCWTGNQKASVSWWLGDRSAFQDFQVTVDKHNGYGNTDTKHLFHSQVAWSLWRRAESTYKSQNLVCIYGLRQWCSGSAASAPNTARENSSVLGTSWVLYQSASLFLIMWSPLQHQWVDGSLWCLVLKFSLLHLCLSSITLCFAGRLTCFEGPRCCESIYTVSENGCLVDL